LWSLFTVLSLTSFARPDLFAALVRLEWKPKLISVALKCRLCRCGSRLPKTLTSWCIHCHRRVRWVGVSDAGGLPIKMRFQMIVESVA
jgi:hypothetical protein